MSAEIYAPVHLLHERMMQRVVPSGPCLIFTGATNSKGYGCVASGRKGKTVLTHRLAVLARDGEIPAGMTVDHLCGEKLCVRPDHLEVVTREENSSRRFRPWLSAAVRGAA